MRKKLGIAAGLVLSLGLVCGGGFAWVFGEFLGDLPVTDVDPTEGVRVVVDGYVTSHVVEVSGGVVLVDAGNDPTAAPILAKLAELDDPPVLALLLTHGHPDHTAGCKVLAERFQGLKVVAHADEVDLIEGRVAAKGPLPRLFGLSDGGCRVTQAVTGGATLNLGRTVFTAHHVPGHTDGSIVWQGKRALFLGDTSTGGSDGQVRAAKWVFSDDLSRANRSLAALHTKVPRREINALVFSHSGPLEDAGALKRFIP